MPCRGIGKHLRPDGLTFSDADGIAMLRGFIRVEPDVRTAHDYGEPAIAELARDVLAANRVYRPAYDGNHVGRKIEVDVLDLLIDERNVPVGRCKSGEVRKR
jgi:hypothetical protein